MPLINKKAKEIKYYNFCLFSPKADLFQCSEMLIAKVKMVVAPNMCGMPMMPWNTVGGFVLILGRIM